MVANALIYHPAVDHYLRYVATTIGRDKALRTVQYFSRFLAWYLYRTNRAATTVAIFDNTKKNFGTVRKAMRIGKFVEHFKAAAKLADAKKREPVLKVLGVGRQLGYGFYLLLDTLAYVDAAGIYKFAGAARLQRDAFRAWAVGLACNILAGIYTLYGLQQRARLHARAGADAEKAVEVKKLQKERSATQLQLLSDVCDFTVPTSGIGLLNLDDGVVGLAGTVSSLIGVSAAWNTTA